MTTQSIPERAALLVIGGGPGGYVTAIDAARRGLDVTLVTDDPPGGTCLNRGCIPSKALLSATERVVAVTDETAADMGIYADPYVDVPELFAWKDDVVGELTDGVAGLCRASGVTLIKGLARFEDETTASIETESGESTISFERAVLATGSRPVELPRFSFDATPILDSAGALALEAVPDRLIVIGGGYIGMELSLVFARLGTAVTVLEALDDPLPRFESELTAPVVETARELGVDINVGEEATSWTREETGVRVQTTGGEYHGDNVLVAVGREPVSDTAGLEAAGIDLEDGFVAVDDGYHTSVDHIFAIGDVIGGKMLAHEAMAEARHVVDRITDEKPTPVGPVPAVVFTDPEIGVIGQSAADARENGREPVVGQFQFAASGRAKTTGERRGFAKLIARAKDGQVIGAKVVGPEASELLAEAALAVQTELTLEKLVDSVHAHPTFSEAWHEAALDALGGALHASN